MDNLNVVVMEPIKVMAIKIWSYIPAIAGAIIILVVGWLLAKLIETIVTKILKAVRLDSVSDKIGISKVLAQGDIKMSLSELVGAIIYWFVILVAVATMFDALNLKMASDIISRLVGYVPNILAAIFILIIGSFLANFIATIIRTAGTNAGLKNAKLMSQISQVVLMVFTVIIAIEQLKVATALLVLAVNIILISIGLGIALAFGLGCKDIAGKFMQDVVNKMNK
ncbi:MAG: hypothetical protein KKH77_01970 [Candidatus Omnitrophica bacterium]|nr:hypothetical protein [Candidatus Omnitrophota bacterium]MBU0881499.1 hypothetical protein [Candidatus Omnitrophota bacterium]MBU0895683.1 hypothetical protein [Candidatus Omnitrophota bacterium]MBU1038279.1 hypothetical protein [Candidatus Omnitrophota bacterium]MBU1809009.1 hypothetical protein [Candidatus Omnitrophota bacterium]